MIPFVLTFLCLRCDAEEYECACVGGPFCAEPIENSAEFIANGDLFSPENARAMLSELGALDTAARNRNRARAETTCPDHAVDGTVCPNCGYICVRCQDSGFDGATTGYDGICDECGGQSASASKITTADVEDLGFAWGGA